MKQPSMLLAGQYDVKSCEDSLLYESTSTTVYKVETPESINARSVICKSIYLPIDCCSLSEDKDLEVKKRTKSKLNKFFNEIMILKKLSKLQNEALIHGISILRNRNNDAVYINMVQKDAGLDLHQLLKHKNLKKFDTQFIILIMEQLFDALNFLHGHHCCHRDVKPENICYSIHNNAITLIDFDLLSLVTINLLRTSRICTVQSVRLALYLQKCLQIRIITVWPGTYGVLQSHFWNCLCARIF